MEKCFLGFVDTVNESIAMKRMLKPRFIRLMDGAAW